MPKDPTYNDRPSRSGHVNDPAPDQLDAATADGSPTTGKNSGPDDAETIDFSAATAGSGAAERELAAERDRNLRLRAELENVRTRTARELTEQSRYAALPVVRDLLPAIDNIDRAFESATKAGESGPLVEGFRLIRQQLSTILQHHNVREIPALGEPFDPQFHAAILQQPSNDMPANHITLVAQPGYQIFDRVVRPSQVIVSSGPA